LARGQKFTHGNNKTGDLQINLKDSKPKPVFEQLQTLANYVEAMPLSAVQIKTSFCGGSLFMSPQSASSLVGSPIN
jgi:hypothetical protein